MTLGEAMLWEVLVNTNLKQGAPRVRAENVLPKQKKKMVTDWKVARAMWLGMGGKVVASGGTG